MADRGIVAVTGGAGFVGLNLVAWLAGEGRRVVALHRSPLDDVAERVARKHAGAVSFVRCDVRDREALAATIAAHGVRDVVHAAAITSPAADETMAMLDVNLRATQALLDLAAAGRLRRIVVVSSAGVFRAAAMGAPLTEDDPVTMDQPYAIFKVAAERLVAFARRARGVDATSVRLGPVYGPFERPTASRRAMSTVHEAVALVRRGEPIVAIGPEVGRDWTHAADVARGVALLLDHDGALAEVYHLGIGRDYTMRETLATIADLVPGTTVRWTDDPERANLGVGLTSNRPPLGIERARADLGYEPSFPLRDGVRDYLGWLDASERRSAAGGPA